MALLNYAESYDSVKSKYKISDPKSGDFIKLFFTKDKHILTHGVDYMSLFSVESDGLVPASTGESTHLLRATGQWAPITVDDLPIKTTLEEALGSPEDTILSTQQVSDYVRQSFTANDAMRFKGTIKQVGNSYEVDTGTISRGFPTECEVGDTYKIAEDGEYAETVCNFGDMLICVKAGVVGGNIQTLNTKQYWTVVEYNLEYVRHSINGYQYWFASSDGSQFTIYAPDELGSVEQLLIGGDEKPQWKHQSEITVGTANKTSSSLAAGEGLLIDTDTFNGSRESTISLVRATTTSIGGIIVDGLKAAQSDKENDDPTISVLDGHLYLTQQNIINALGYVPSDNATRWRPISVEDDSIGERELKFSTTENIQIILDDSDPNIANISYTLGWYNINSGQFEYDEDSL